MKTGLHRLKFSWSKCLPRPGAPFETSDYGDWPRFSLIRGFHRAARSHGQLSGHRERAASRFPFK